MLSKPFFCVDFDVCFVLKEDPVIFHYKISSRGSQVLFIYLFLSVLIKSHDGIYLLKHSSYYLTTDTGPV